MFHLKLICKDFFKDFATLYNLQIIVNGIYSIRVIVNANKF